MSYNISHVANDAVKFRVNLFNKDDELAAVQESAVGSGTLEVPQANFWWPYLMDPNPGYLYTLRVSVCGILFKSNRKKTLPKTSTKICKTFVDYLKILKHFPI